MTEVDRNHRVRRLFAVVRYIRVHRYGVTFRDIIEDVGQSLGEVIHERTLRRDLRFLAEIDEIWFEVDYGTCNRRWHYKYGS